MSLSAWLRRAATAMGVGPEEPTPSDSPSPPHDSVVDTPLEPDVPSPGENPTAHILTAPTHYDVLQVSRAATLDEVRSAYKLFAKATHPDTNPGDPLAHARFLKVQEAYEILSDSACRSRYDLQLDRLSGSSGYWTPKGDMRITFSMSYYGYMIPMDVLDRARKEAATVAAETGISEGEATSRLLLDPLIHAAKAELKRNPRNVTSLIALADLYFHTYRSAQALEFYLRAFSVSDTQATAEQAVHLGAVYFYAGEYWGGVEHLGRLLSRYPDAFESRLRWAEEADRLLRAARDTAMEGLADDARLELGISFLEKRIEFGHDPAPWELKAIGDLAIKAGQMSLAAEYLRRARTRWLSGTEVSALMRSFAKAGLQPEAEALGIQALPADFIGKTLKDSEKPIVRALAEMYEKSERIPEALALYKKLARYKDASATLKKKVDKLAALTKSMNELGEASTS